MPFSLKHGRVLARRVPLFEYNHSGKYGQDLGYSRRKCVSVSCFSSDEEICSVQCVNNFVSWKMLFKARVQSTFTTFKGNILSLDTREIWHGQTV